MLTIWVCNFWRKDFGAKAAHKMLVKLIPGVWVKPAACTRIQSTACKTTSKLLSWHHHAQHNDTRPNNNHPSNTQDNNTPHSNTKHKNTQHYKTQHKNTQHNRLNVINIMY